MLQPILWKPKHVEAARHICEEVRVVLSSLRGGPPDVAYGELAQNLRDLRTNVRARFLDVTLTSPSCPSSSLASSSSSVSGGGDQVKKSKDIKSSKSVADSSSENYDEVIEGGNVENIEGTNDGQPSHLASSSIPNENEYSSKEETKPKENADEKFHTEYKMNKRDEVGPYARPFLSVILDPQAAGPHTLVALRALHRLIERRSLVPYTRISKSTSTNGHDYWSGTDHAVSLDPLMIGVLQCKFEQTDAGADEAVEMAIADLLSLLISIDSLNDSDETNDDMAERIRPETFIEAFNTVFVTRNTFVHSPALCYHFEDVLKGMVSAAFRKKRVPHKSPSSPSSKFAAQHILEFLVQQLFHTPLVVSGGIGGYEAQAAYDATRILCLRLARCCLQTGWGDYEHFHIDETEKTKEGKSHLVCEWEETPILRIIQEELCLSLLMTGQAYWSDEKDGMSSNTEILSLEILSEICATITTMWSITSLRYRLQPQFEAIFTGFFQRALSLLRRRNVPADSDDYMANIIFDSEIEIVLETLVDILHLHDHAEIDVNHVETGLGALETLFAMYDCNINRSDVAMGLITELCKCCGGNIKMGDNNVTLSHSNSDFFLDDEESSQKMSAELANRRQVPARLKELCGEALIGSLQCIFGEPMNISNSIIGHQSSRSKDTEKDDGKNKHRLRETKNLKRIMHRGMLLFNKNSKDGLKYLISEGILPATVTPIDVAKFLRQGIMVGLDKVAVGEYLGAVGKGPVAGKSPHDYERDWFHKDTLKAYCASFRFENQSLLEGLRMFLSSFRLPGEAQQIDRILQAFAESCGQKCEEGRELNLFSNDPKKAADAAYLLSFSLIMLNTDLHNDNIRPERKMSKEDFIKNNTNYGRDITDEGKELPREVLENLYDSIKEVELRTEGEGADGIMTIERWKDVLYGQGKGFSWTQEDSLEYEPISYDNNAKRELKQVLIESAWQPLLSSISGFWDVDTASTFIKSEYVNRKRNEIYSGSEMLGSQGSRLGIDLATKLLSGLRSMGMKDIFRTIFVEICKFSGLLNFAHGIVDRTESFTSSVERQSAVVVAINTAKDAADDIGVMGWKYVWCILFELRDLKLLSSNRRRGLTFESDHDLLFPNARKEFKRNLIQQGLGGQPSDMQFRNSSLMGTMSRIFFGDNDNETNDASSRTMEGYSSSTRHEKEKLLLWDDIDQDYDDMMTEEDLANLEKTISSLSPGAAFISLLMLENSSTSLEEKMYADGGSTFSSRRARIRIRLSNACDFGALISGSRYLSMEAIQDLILSLLDVVKQNQKQMYGMRVPPQIASSDSGEETPQVITDEVIVLSPASEALAEIFICEIAIKNRDRIGSIWETILKKHYLERLSAVSEVDTSREEEAMKGLCNPGIEKCVTGLLRICCWMVSRNEVADEILSSLQLLFPPDGKRSFIYYNMDKHLGESIWRISCDVDSLQQLGTKGWDALLGLIKWCASRGGAVVLAGSRRNGLAEDDPSLQAFRAINLMLHAKELKHIVPLNIVDCIIELVKSGEKGYCATLMIAGLDLLNVMHCRLEPATKTGEDATMWWKCWFKVLRGIFEASDSTFMNVRQHALSMLTDALIDNHGRAIAENKIYTILIELSTPLAARRITALLETEEVEQIWEEVMIELELCISLIFKPFLHHLRRLLIDKDNLLILWKSILSAVTLLLGNEHENDSEAPNFRTKDNLLSTTKELASEHLRNAVMVLSASKVISNESNDESDISAVTWTSIQEMEFCKISVDEWKKAAIIEDVQHFSQDEKRSEASPDDLDDDIVIVSEVGEDTCESG